MYVGDAQRTQRFHARELGHAIFGQKGQNFAVPGFDRVHGAARGLDPNVDLAALEGRGRFRGAAEEDGFKLAIALGGVHVKFKENVCVAADAGGPHHNGLVALGRGGQQFRAVFPGRVRTGDDAVGRDQRLTDHGEIFVGIGHGAQEVCTQECRMV